MESFPDYTTGIGPGSVSVIVEALTDNRKRTAPNVRHIFSKFGGSLGTSGQVSWMFERKGYIEVDGTATEDVLEAVIDAGADDVEELEITGLSAINHVAFPLQKTKKPYNLKIWRD